jgi:hypothetical protein
LTTSIAVVIDAASSWADIHEEFILCIAALVSRGKCDAIPLADVDYLDLEHVSPFYD